MKKIEFICTKGIIHEPDRPVPAKNLIPTWYKNIKPYKDPDNRIFLKEGIEIGNAPAGFHFDYENGVVDNQTIKKCVPVLDSITSGYIIKTYCDILVEKGENDLPFFSWAQPPIDSIEVINFHHLNQVTGHPDIIIPQVAKFSNIWAIKTPPGYSCLFITPSHSDTPIRIFPGIVDTDKAHAAVEFPFVLKNPNFTGLIPKGTAIAQVIPIKRDSWESSYYEKSDKDLIKYMRSIFVDGYRKLFWTKKHYN